MTPAELSTFEVDVQVNNDGSYGPLLRCSLCDWSIPSAHDSIRLEQLVEGAEGHVAECSDRAPLLPDEEELTAGTDSRRGVGRAVRLGPLRPRSGRLVMNQQIKSKIVDRILTAALDETRHLAFDKGDEFPVGIPGVHSAVVEDGLIAVTLDDGSKSIFYVTVREARA